MGAETFRLVIADVTHDALATPTFLTTFRARTRPGKWGCLEWAGAFNHGYGTLLIPGTTRPVKSHRAAWILHHRRSVPHDLVVDHLCCNPRCVNPEHLEAVTREVNGQRVKTPPDGWVWVGSRKYPRRRKRRGTRVNEQPYCGFLTQESH